MFVRTGIHCNQANHNLTELTRVLSRAFESRTGGLRFEYAVAQSTALRNDPSPLTLSSVIIHLYDQLYRRCLSKFCGIREDFSNLDGFMIGKLLDYGLSTVLDNYIPVMNSKIMVF